jgi:hypothetical protein
MRRSASLMSFRKNREPKHVSIPAVRSALHNLENVSKRLDEQGVNLKDYRERGKAASPSKKEVSFGVTTFAEGTSRGKLKEFQRQEAEDDFDSDEDDSDGERPTLRFIEWMRDTWRKKKSPCEPGRSNADSSDLEEFAARFGISKASPQDPEGQVSPSLTKVDSDRRRTFTLGDQTPSLSRANSFLPSVNTPLSTVPPAVELVPRVRRATDFPARASERSLLNSPHFHAQPIEQKSKVPGEKLLGTLRSPPRSPSPSPVKATGRESPVGRLQKSLRQPVSVMWAGEKEQNAGAKPERGGSVESVSALGTIGDRPGTRGYKHSGWRPDVG